MANFVPAFEGYAILAKTAGPTAGTVLAANAQVVIPFFKSLPFNIFSNAYGGVVNATGYASQTTAGKRRSGFTIIAPVKPSWFTCALVNSLLFNLDTAGNARTTDKFSFKLYNTATSRVFDWARCTHLKLEAHASGGPVIATMAFISRWGETECPYSTTLPDGEAVPAAVSFSAPSNPDSGSTTDISSWDWRSDSALGNTNVAAVWTCLQSRGFTLMLMRGQGCVDYDDGTVYCKDIASGMFAGSLGLDVSPSSGTIPSTAATLRFDTNGSAKFKMSLLLKQDSTEEPQDISIQNETINYTLFDASAGGNPASCATY